MNEVIKLVKQQELATQKLMKEILNLYIKNTKSTENELKKEVHKKIKNAN